MCIRDRINALDNQRLHHAYLFTGTRGVGKTTIARILAKCLNCETGVSSTPCGECSVCREIDEGRFVDPVSYTHLDVYKRQVFGGGTAYLELTGEDLLDTGVAIMARPPGKKNSTIHLLSGGEKALTALALVFAIFQLNPAPFCMLDEVDAPLDDANVGRYARLVKEMSERCV